MIEPAFHPEAQAEYSAAIAWYELRSASAASRLEAEIERLILRMTESPDLFPRYDDAHRFAILKRFPYSIVYRTDEERIHIVAVAHSSRLPGYWHERI